MALVVNDRVKETTAVVGTGTATLLGAALGFQSFAVIGNGNTTYYCISDQGGANWEVGEGTYTLVGTILTRAATPLSSSNAGASVSFPAGTKDVFIVYPSSKGVWLDASGNAIGLGTPAAFVGTNITGTASGLTAGNVTTNANLTGAITSSGNATSLGSFTSLQLATALTNETGTGSAVFSDNASLLNPTYTGTLTGGTGVVDIGTNQIYKDASGNVGIGVVPNVWSVGKAIEIGSAGNSILGAGAGNFQLLSNLYFNGGTKFATAASTFGSSFQLVNSSTYSYFAFNTTSVAGTAGNTATVLERMRIDSSGNVGIGASSPVTKLDVYGAQVLNRGVIQALDSTAQAAGTGAGLVLGGFYTSTQTSAGVQIKASKTNGTSGDYGFDMSFLTLQNGTSNLTERMRIDSTGQQSSTIVGYGTYNEYKCRAWVNFNGTGTVAIRASGNVSSITDNGVGLYTVNFTTAMPDANYAVNVSGRRSTAGYNTCIGGIPLAGTYSTTAVQVQTTGTSDARLDADIACVSIFR